MSDISKYCFNTIPVWRRSNCFTFSLFCLFPSSSTHSAGHAIGSLKENWYEFLSRWGMPDVCFSSLFFCRITRCQRGGPPLDPHSRTGWQFCALGAPRKADDGADQLNYYCLASQKSGNWQLLSKWCWGWELNIWTRSSRWQFWKRAQEPENYNVRPLRELDGDWTRGAVLFGCLSSALEITAAVPRWWRERTYENYRTPTARDNPSIRGEEGRLVSGTLARCRRCLVMAEMGGTLNSCSCLWRNWGPILNNIQTNLDLEQYLDQPCIGRDLGDGLLQGSLRQSEAPGGEAFYLCLQWNLICIFARQLGPRGWIWCETWAQDTGDKAKYRKMRQ